MNEGVYDERRLQDFVAGRTRGFSRRDLLMITAAIGAGAAVGAPAEAAAAAAAGPIVKPLPPELFTVHGTNAETRWSALKDQGYLVPVDRFFVRNHTSTPIIDAGTWSLEVAGSGLHRERTAHFSLRDLKRLPSEVRTVAVECAGNARSYFIRQQGQAVSGTAWGLGAVGVARWRGVRLSTVLRRAGLRRHALDVQPTGLDANFVSGGVDLGPVRRPFPLRKALDDVLLAYEMNDEPLPPDHGAPVRVLVPGWIGIASIKWVGRIEVSAEPLFSPWNTQFRLPNHPHQAISASVQPTAFQIAPDPTGQVPYPAGSGSPWGHGCHYRHRHGLLGTARQFGAAQLAARRRPARCPAVVHVLRPGRGPQQTRRRREGSGRGPRPQHHPA